ncbi:MAG: thioredoxin-disulfide reductase [Ruminococcaceae bacterium]|nr:thioredoxin-disulfide reductase [Oscillospiraceae bacterium]
MLDLMIVGGGPAGMNAALYAARAGLSCVLFEKMFAGGQMATTSLLENYIGFPGGVDAVTLAMSMSQQATDAGAEIRYEEIYALSLAGAVKQATTAKETVEARSVILCMGASPRLLGVPGEERLRGHGVSYCATCDGALYKGKTVAVVGGGDTALEDAIFLSRFAKQVYLIHRRDSFRAVRAQQEKVKKLSNVSMMLDSVVTEIMGEHEVSGLRVRQVKTEVETSISVDGLFIAVGTNPNTALIGEQLPLEAGYVVTDEEMKTAIPGVFAAGDLRKKPLRQVITAAADGAVAAVSALRYIEE